MGFELILGGLLAALAVGLLLTLIAGDVRRRRVQQRRKWYERRLHAAMDRVQAMKFELEPPLDGIGEFAHVVAEHRKTRKKKSKPPKPTSPAPDPEPAAPPASSEEPEPVT
ncbi:MAG: hypothetical protein AAF488_04305 [Planctomycetota bacterium]